MRYEFNEKKRIELIDLIKIARQKVIQEEEGNNTGDRALS